MNHQTIPSANNNPKIQKLVEELNNKAKTEGFSSWMELAAQRDPAIADIMARMIKAEIDNKEPRPWCALCTTQQHSHPATNA